MAKYPIFLEVGGRRVVVIGGGTVAIRKAQTLLAAGARLVIVTEKTDEILTALCASSGAELIKSKYSKSYLSGAVLAVAATNDCNLNRQIYKDCQELEILCNVVDQPELCDFFVPAVIKRGGLQIAIGTEGYCPAYAGHLRKKLERMFSDKHGQFLSELEVLRKRLIKEISNPADRKVLLGKLVDDKSFEYFVENGDAQWHIFVDRLISGEHKNQQV